MKHKACRPWIDTTGDMLNRHPYFQVCLIWRSSHTGNPTIGLKLFPLFLIFKANVSIPSDDVVPSCRRCTTHCNMIAGQIRCFFNGRSVETAVNFSWPNQMLFQWEECWNRGQFFMLRMPEWLHMIQIDVQLHDRSVCWFLCNGLTCSNDNICCQNGEAADSTGFPLSWDFWPDWKWLRLRGCCASMACGHG